MRAQQRSASVKPVEVTPKELSDALALLREEQAAGTYPTGVRPLLFEVVRSIASAALVVSLPFGLAIIAVDRPWGLSLLGISGLATALSAFLVRTRSLRETVRGAREAIDPAALKAALDLRKSQRRRESIFAVPVFLASPVLFFGGTAYLVWRLAFDREVSAWALGAIVLGVCLVLGWSVLQNYRDYRYFLRVAAAKDRLERLAAAPPPEDGTVTLGPSDVSVLARAETQQVRRTVKAAFADLPKVLEDAWAVSVAPEAQESLERLAEDDPEAWSRVVGAIQSLQFDPTPPDAREVESERRASASLNYRLDEHERRVYVLKVDPQRDVDA